ncbi:MAG: GspE/PulE family protein [Candidatus Paceibacterota bacterium]|jgi:type IV pilus assembly protein PilB
MMNLIDLLAQKGALTSAAARQAKEEVEGSHESAEAVLKQLGVPFEKILEVKGEYLGVPVRSIPNPAIPFEVLKYLPEESANFYRMIPLAVTDNVLEVGIVDPENFEARDALNFISSKDNIPYKLFLISEEDFLKAMECYKGLSGEVTKALTELEGDLSDEEKEIASQEAADQNLSHKINQTNIIEDAPVTKIVATILRYAIEGEASDVHIEPLSDKVRVRFRLDGVLHTSLILPPKVLNAVVARIKILSNMKLDEKRKPQDGRFSARIDGRKIDFRVSTFPVYYGEKVVMRILDQAKGVKGLDKLDLPPQYLEMVRNAIKKPYGLILISGPTGSGKTTTLYSMLQEIDKEGHNVLSLEDPVEYNVDGVSQSQVRPEIGYTFATGLRTTLRQDPDIIMVGEIRDKETAGLAIQAALTGHLVLSTIHTNDAIGVIPRLIDMGVDPYLIAPTLILSMAQRLVAKLCPDGGTPMPIEGSIEAMMEKQFADLPEPFKKQIPKTREVFQATPTADCPKGTRGRMGVFEMFEVDRELEKVILTNATGPDIWKAVRAKGMITMKEDAIIKALNKQIPFEEINSLV